MAVVDLFAPASPNYLGVVDTRGRVQEVAVFGSYAAVADNVERLSVVDLAP